MITSDGDVADRIALLAYGRTAGATEELLAANPALSGLGPVLPAGLRLVLPDVAPPPVAATVSLWD